MRTCTRFVFAMMGIGLFFAASSVVAQNNRAKKPAVSEEVMALYEPGEFKGVRWSTDSCAGVRVA